METLLEILNEGGYLYHFENDVFSFLDERINDITLSHYNFHLYIEIRKAKIRVLDLSGLNSVPKEISGFEYIEEIRMPILRNIIPVIQNCPRLNKVVFNPKSITQLRENSFRGWPKIEIISFSPQLKEVDSFCLGGEFDIVDFSECSNLTLREHAFQRSNVKTIILPTQIKSFVNYLFFDCSKLENIVAKGVVKANYNSFGNVGNLRSIIVSPEYDNDSFAKSLNYGLSIRKLKSGIIIDSDDLYSYIWCISDFKFYYSNKLSFEYHESFLSFYIDYPKKIEFGESAITIHEHHDEYYINELFKGELSLSDQYTQQRNNGIYVLPSVNLQQKAIDSYFQIKDLLHQDIRSVILDITNTVQNLNIDSIIDSYKTTVEEYTITKVGGDDRFYSTIITQASYTDDYIETLLPSYYSHYKDSGYTTNWPWTTKEKKSEYDIRDSELRNIAKTNYSQNDHISFLIKKHIENLLQLEGEIEQYLHLRRAKEIATDFKYLSGLNRVLKLNTKKI